MGRGMVRSSSQWRAEAVVCPGPTRFLDALESIFYSSCKISDDLFYQLSNFRTIRSLDAPSRAASCPGNDIFLLIVCHLRFTYIIFKKSGPSDAPRVDARGHRTVRTPLCTPLPRCFDNIKKLLSETGKCQLHGTVPLTL